MNAFSKVDTCSGGEGGYLILIRFSNVSGRSAYRNCSDVFET